MSIVDDVQYFEVIPSVLRRSVLWSDTICPIEDVQYFDTICPVEDVQYFEVIPSVL